MRWVKGPVHVGVESPRYLTFETSCLRNTVCICVNVIVQRVFVKYNDF